MEILPILAAAASSYIFGAVWYSLLSQPWMDAVGLTEEDIKPNGKQDSTPFIIAAVCVIVIAAMMNYLFIGLGIFDDVLSGLLHGLGLGLFIALPWMIMHHTYGIRKRSLTVIDGGYIVGGCSLMGLVLTLF